MNTLVLDKDDSAVRSICLTILASLLIGLSHFAIPLPWTPVPLAIRGIVILTLACLLGPKRTFIAVLGFFFQAAIGLPVGMGGTVGLWGPSGGYCIGYLAATLLVGYNTPRTSAALFVRLTLGTALFYLFGVPYLASFIGWKQACVLGTLPFLLGDFVKAIACVKFLQWIGFCFQKR